MIEFANDTERIEVTLVLFGKTISRTFEGDVDTTFLDAADFVVDELLKALAGVGDNAAVASASGLESSQSVQNDLFDNVVLQRQPTKMELIERARAEEEGVAELPSSVGALLRFEGFSFRGQSGFAVGTTPAYEYEGERLRSGVLLPYENVNTEEPNVGFHRIGLLAYASYAVLTDDPDPLTLRLGGYGSVSATVFHAGDRLKDFATFSGGPTISAEKEFKTHIIENVIESITASFGFTLTGSRATTPGSETKTSIKTGFNLGVPIADNYVANLFTAYNVQVAPSVPDPDYFDVGAEFIIFFTQLLSGTLGVKTVQGLEEFKSFEGFLGVIYRF